MISKETIEKITEAANLHEVIGDFLTLNKQGASYYATCPKCGKSGKGKGLIITPSKNIFKCFSCDLSGKGAIAYLMESENKTYPEALTYIANKYGIPVDDKPEQKGPQRKLDKNQETYRDRQLKESGLSDADQKAYVYVDESTQKIVDVFRSGTIDQYGQVTHGDDMIIYYYDLQGKPVKYQKPKSNKFEQLFRVRWQNPKLHPDKNGRPVKYKSPYGSGSHLYIPEIIRKIYQDGRVIDKLFIQEGEKKAEKACKHGIPSVGIMGINNIGREGKLPYELQLIVQKCKVKEVIFVLDSDFDELSNDLKADEPIERRPYNFFVAVRNFKEYFKTFTNIGIYIEIFFAHLKSKETKGIDDLLTALKGSEDKLIKDINQAVNEKSGEGELINVYKISTLSDLKLMEYFHLQNIDAFTDYYKEAIINSGLPEFTFKKHRWRFNQESGALELAQPLLEDEMFWEDNSYEVNGKKIEKHRFRYTRAYTFLKRRGFGRIKLLNNSYQFARIESKIVRAVEAWEIKDFVFQLAHEIAPEPVVDMLYRGGKMYFGPDSLGNMDFIEPVFETNDKNFQILFFKEKFWKITAEGIEEKNVSELINYVWQDKIINFNAEVILEGMLKVQRITKELLAKAPAAEAERWKDFIDHFSVTISEKGANCHFLRFLLNTGNFAENKSNPNFKESLEINLHLISKMTAIGYLLHKYRNKSCEKAVIAMDGRETEIGDSNGRTGKSLIGMALEKMVPVVTIGGKNRHLTEDPFWAEEVNEKTDIIFIDDARANIDFEFFFPVITGKLTINSKGAKKFTLSEENTPKIYLTTNHAVGGEGSSFADRQAIILFSDYYNDDHKPVDDFGINFFLEWEADQWNLFYNLMAECLMLYFRFGLVSVKDDRILQRKRRQMMGEEFLTWANEYYGTTDDGSASEVFGTKIDARIPRKEVYDDFCTKNPNLKKYVTATKFKKKLKIFCDYKGLIFNPFNNQEGHSTGADDKSGGVEYFTVAKK